MIAQILQFVPFIMKLLTGAGVIKDPEQERELRLKLLEYASRERTAASEEFSAFIRATTPDAQYVWPWVNSVVTLMRPAITSAVVGTVLAAFWIPGLAERATTVLEGFSRAGTAGLLFLAIPLWWFFGRSAEKLVPGLALLRQNGAPNGHNGQPTGAASATPTLDRVLKELKEKGQLPDQPGLGG